MAFWQWLTSGTKAAENATEIGKTMTKGIVSGIDAIFLTEEEKIQYKASSAERVLKFWGTFGTENTEQSKARRDIAKAVMKVWLFLVLACVVVRGFDKEYSTFILEVIGSITWLVGMIAATYFAPHQIAKVWKGKGAE